MAREARRVRLSRSASSKIQLSSMQSVKVAKRSRARAKLQPRDSSGSKKTQVVKRLSTSLASSKRQPMKVQVVARNDSHSAPTKLTATKRQLRSLMGRAGGGGRAAARSSRAPSRTSARRRAFRSAFRALGRSRGLVWAFGTPPPPHPNPHPPPPPPS